MKSRTLVWSLAILGRILIATLTLSLQPSGGVRHRVVTSAGLHAAQPVAMPSAQAWQGYAKLPLNFEKNEGQSDPQVKFLSHGAGYELFLTSNGVTLSMTPADPGADEKHIALAALHRAAGQPVASDAPANAAEPTVLRMKLVGANPSRRVMGLDQLPGKSNYFIGNNPKKWRTNVAHYAKVEYAGVYPGVDLVFYGNQGHMEYDFVAAPGANPKAIKIALEGTTGSGRLLQPQIDGQGDLVLHAAGGDIRFHKPVVYQGAREHLLAGRYTLEGQEIGFQVDGYDSNRPLVIDPVLSFSTYLGGSNFDRANTIAVDKSGNVYVAGRTASSDFPTKNPIQGFTGNNSGCPSKPCFDIFVTKFDSRATTLTYSTYIGGSNNQRALEMALDSSNNVYVTGFTVSSDFPVTAGAFQTTFGGTNNTFGSGDAYALKLNSAGSSLLYSTYLGGSGDDLGEDIVVDSAGNAYVAGFSSSTNYPTTAGVLQTTCTSGDCGFVTKVNPTGTALVFSTYFGGTAVAQAFGIAIDSSGKSYITGVAGGTGFPTTAGVIQPNCPPSPCSAADEGIVLKLNSTGTTLIYSTYLDGTLDSTGNSIAVDKSGNAYVTGGTDSTDFPTTAGAAQTTFGGSSTGCRFNPSSFLCGDGFVSKLNPTASALVYSTFLGGNVDDQGTDIAIDSGGTAYISGTTDSTNFPTVNAIQGTFGGGTQDGFVTKLNTAGSAFAYSTYFGGNGADDCRLLALDSTRSVYAAGGTTSTNLTVTPGVFQSICGTDGTCNGGLEDAFVIKIADAPRLRVAITHKTLSGGVLAVTYNYNNAGTGSAQAVTVTGVTFTTVSGTGTVTYNSPPLPVVVGNINQSASTTVTLNYNVPATVTKFTATESVTLNDDGGAALKPLTFRQTIVP